jgi:hypothetical protein
VCRESVAVRPRFRETAFLLPFSVDAAASAAGHITSACRAAPPSSTQNNTQHTTHSKTHSHSHKRPLRAPSSLPPYQRRARALLASRGSSLSALSCLSLSPLRRTHPFGPLVVARHGARGRPDDGRRGPRRRRWPGACPRALARDGLPKVVRRAHVVVFCAEGSVFLPLSVSRSPLFLPRSPRSPPPAGGRRSALPRSVARAARREVLPRRVGRPEPSFLPDRP